MLARLARFFQRHPVLRDTILWALPALLIGAILRGLLLSYLPLGYWGSDSRSYYGFAHRLLAEGTIDYDEKRRYLYPVLMVPVSILPGTPLRWLAWLQHGLGLFSILPLAYVVRKTMRLWKWWIVPVTLAYALHPMFLWYEHELLGEVVFFAGLAWAFGGWMAWTQEKDPARARRLFWWFYVPLAAFLLTKPAGRFVLPGLACGLLFVRAWRVLDWTRWAALAVLAGVTFTVGSNKQGAWLLYTATFPLTQLDTPLHADYKADIRQRVTEQAAHLDTHYLDSRAAMDFLESPSENGGTPLWAALDDKNAATQKRKLYMDLALEAIRARPRDYLYLTLQRLTASSNLSGFEEDRFISTYYPTRFRKLYDTAQKDIATQSKDPARARFPSLPTAFGIPKGEPLPPFEEFQTRLAPHPGTWAESAVLATARTYQAAGDFVRLPHTTQGDPESAKAFTNTRITFLGWWTLASLLVSLVWWRTLGVWTITTVGYVVGVYLCALVQGRFFLPAWLVMLPVLVTPLDLALSRLLPHRPGDLQKT
jgi:hypothetical protein